MEILTRDGFISFLYFLPALLLSLSIHEFGHAFVAYKLGDKSQKELGRLTIAPFAHMDWMGFICIVLFGFGWGKPVMVDDRNFKKRGRDNMLVSLAGPLSNIILAIVFTIVIKALWMCGISEATVTSKVGLALLDMLWIAIIFNVTFAAFNLIPLPPFDGSKVLYYFLPYGGKKFMDKLERYSIYIILFLVITDIYQFIILPIDIGLSWLINFILML